MEKQDENINKDKHLRFNKTEFYYNKIWMCYEGVFFLKAIKIIIRIRTK